MAKFDDGSKSTWYRVMGAALALPSVKVDRESFLQAQLAPHCDDTQVKLAIANRPTSAGISSSVIDEIADGCIRRHRTGATFISFVTGLPGGLAMAATIPADIAQFYHHVLVLQQKLVYLYGWPDLLNNREVDDETKYHLTLFTGVMLGVAKATKVVPKVASKVAKDLAWRAKNMPLTQTVWYPIVKQVAKRMGFKITKDTLARGATKVVPVVSAVVSASVTAAMMGPMAKRLKNHLRELPLAKVDTG